MVGILSVWCRATFPSVPRMRDLLAPFAGWFRNTRIVIRLHPILCRAVGGRGLLAHSHGMLNVILTTTGKSSGQPRDVPLYALREGIDWWSAARRGAPTGSRPWWATSARTPRASVRVRRDSRATRFACDAIRSSSC